MHTKRSLFFITCSFIFQIIAVHSHSQELNPDQFKDHPWVDSVFGSLSITERINQLLVLDIKRDGGDEPDLPVSYGGIIIEAEGPVSYRTQINKHQQSLSLSALVFSKIAEPVDLKMDSIDHFGAAHIFSFVNEPYIFYETGVALARQCKALGISALLDDRNDLYKKDFNRGWNMVELNQGLIDNQIIPMKSIKTHQFQKDTSDFIDNIDAWDMVIISPVEVPEFHQMIQSALERGTIDIEDLESKCKWVLVNKKWAGLDKPYNSFFTTLGLIHNPHHLLVQEEIAKSLLVVTNLDANQFPIKHLENKRIAHLTIGDNPNTVFCRYANKYTRVDHFEIAYDVIDKAYVDLWSELNNYDIIICTYYNLDQIPELASAHDGFIIFQDWMLKSEKYISVAFVNESILSENSITTKALNGIVVMDDNQLTNKLTPQLIFGGIGTIGRIDIPKGTGGLRIGVDVNSINRFSYTLPLSAGLDARVLDKMDSIAIDAIQKKAMPGCQILVAKDNKVVYQKSFGFHTYDSLRKVSNDDLYDLASLTKVSGALPGLMKLYQDGKFDLDATLGTYLTDFKRGNKKKLTFREILAHQAGLKAWIPYWKTTIKKSGKYRRKTLSETKTEDYPYEIAEHIFLHKDYKKKIHKQIRKSKVGKKKYLYSGLTFYLFPEIIEAITGEKYEDYIYSNFYKPLGATTLTYNPLEKFEIDHIVPTEYDSLFRKSKIHGKVHDEGAAMMEGVSSNAGLFSNANDLAKLFQMYCNYGTYGDVEYLNEETIREFTRCQYPENDNRRGLGFDRPLPEPHENGNTAKSVSQLSFGHSGFTGTFAWVDPEYKLVYIFLSNRVYPTRENTKLYKMNVRTNIQEVIYESMK